MMQIGCSAKNDNSICDSDVLVPKYEPPHRCSGSTQSYTEILTTAAHLIHIFILKNLKTCDR